MLLAAHSRELCRRDPTSLSGLNYAGCIPPEADDMFPACATKDIFLEHSQREC
jgi:hypothetical protein